MNQDFSVFKKRIMLLAHHPTVFEIYLWNCKNISPELTAGKSQVSEIHLLFSFNLILHDQEYRLWMERGLFIGRWDGHLCIRI